jgi:ethanolamine ammonia-lyase small subunit
MNDRIVSEFNSATPATVTDPWARLRSSTPARIGLGRAGEGLPTVAMLDFQAAHALARDAVHAAFDPERLTTRLAEIGLNLPTVTVRSQAADRLSYLQRPDLGRRLTDADTARLTAMAGPEGCDIVFVIADGLSATAVHQHAIPMLQATLALLPGWRVGPLVLAGQARVALGDDIGAALKARLVAVLIGERPGLSAADSLGVYLTFDPRPGRVDSERNCLSNIRPPVGLPYALAARKLSWLIHQARERGLTGVALKDEMPGVRELTAPR